MNADMALLAHLNECSDDLCPRGGGGLTEHFRGDEQGQLVERAHHLEHVWRLLLLNKKQTMNLIALCLSLQDRFNSPSQNHPD